MNKIIIILFLVFSFSSCTMVYGTIDLATTVMVSGHELYYTDYGVIRDYQDIIVWINNNIEYRSNKFHAYEQAEDIIKRGWGNCENKAIVFMNIAKIKLGIECHLISLDADTIVFERSIVEGGIPNHMIVSINSKLIDPGCILDIKTAIVQYEYTYNQVYN